MKLNTWLKINEEKLVRLRRHLHQYPEVGFKEFKTSAYLQQILLDAGFTICQTPLMKTGFVCDYGSGEGPILGIRCDLDALLLDEAKSVPYASQNDGVMHACGHDVHMTIVTGLALWMMESKPKTQGTIRFIFQPAEEQAPGGAQSMIDSGYIDDIDHIVGLHMLPRLEAGKIAIRKGAMSASVEMVNITLKGEGGHTSRPHETTDLILIMAHTIIAIDERIDREIDHRSPVVLSFGKVTGGGTFNVIPSKVILQGTLRFLDPDLCSKLHRIIEEVITHIGTMHGADIQYEIHNHAPGIMNDDHLTDIVKAATLNALGEGALVELEHASMGGEDFAFYLDKIPGTYFRVGCSDGVTRDLHTVNFDVNESCIPTAIRVLDEVISRYYLIP